MFTLPPILQEDLLRMQAALGELITRGEALSALVTDQGGNIVATQGAPPQGDLSTLAALAANAYAAGQEIAKLLQEPNFTSLYQQGDRFSMVVNGIEGRCLLIVVFSAQKSVGAVKYYAAAAVKAVAQQLAQARARAPNEGLDLSLLDLKDSGEFFRKQPPAK